MTAAAATTKKEKNTKLKKKKEKKKKTWISAVSDINNNVIVGTKHDVCISHLFISVCVVEY